MPYSPDVASARSALSNHSRWHPDDAEGLTQRRQRLVAEKLAEYIARTVATAPPLTDEQVSRLTRLLRTDRGLSA